MDRGSVNWLHHLWFGYFWPSLEGNGPEALVQTVVYGIIAYLFIPVVRKFVNSHMTSLHRKLDHIVKHSPDIPDMEDE